MALPERLDQIVHRAAEPGQDVGPGRRLVHGDRDPVQRFGHVEDHAGDVVADQRRHLRALQPVGRPVLPGHVVVVVERHPGRLAAGRGDQRVDARRGQLRLRHPGRADVVQLAAEAGRALIAQARQRADVADSGHAADSAVGPEQRVPAADGQQDGRRGLGRLRCLGGVGGLGEVSALRGLRRLGRGGGASGGSGRCAEAAAGAEGALVAADAGRAMNSPPSTTVSIAAASSRARADRRAGRDRPARGRGSAIS